MYLSRFLSGKPLHSIGMSRHYELLYNMGIQMLHCGKPVAAFECLVEAVQVFRTNPRLWLRLAECCKADT
jgi:CCR4-NOT transcription complex subunit 10